MNACAFEKIIVKNVIYAESKVCNVGERLKFCIF